MKPVRTLLASSLLALSACGCSVIPPMYMDNDKSLDPLVALQPSAASEQYDVISQARARNSVVLEIVGSKDPVRVLPLPTDGRSVFVSDLLKQSGLTKEFDRMQATLYRNSPNTLGGIRMGIHFHNRSNQITAEHDYALQAGDRLEVAELEINPFESFSDLIMPSGGNRRMVAY